MQIEHSKLRCFIPIVKSNENSTQNPKASLEDTEKLAKQLISPLLSTCFYRIEGWWTYEGTLYY